MLAVVGELDRALSATGRKAPAWLRDVRDYVDTHFRERFSIEALAGRAGVHPAHLSRVFGRHHGVTIGEHVRLRRVAWAWHQVVHTTLPLSEIALEAGFADQAHFTRVFKQVTRLTPSRLRGGRETPGPTTVPLYRHSTRSAIIGSTRAARRAGQ